MVKKFLFHMFSSITGTIIALMIVVVIFAAVIGGAVAGLSGSSNKKNAELRKGSILAINLDGEIQECEKPFSPSLSMLTDGNFKSPQTLKDIHAALKEAATNKDVAAVYIKCGDLSAAPATLDALRNAILEFKKLSKGEKKVYAYADDFSQGCYYVASVADSIFMNPEGSFAMRGLTMSNFYFKDLLDKVGVNMQVAKVGTYKSAVEPYILDHMSEPARAQLDTMLTNMWHHITDNICASRRGITPALLDSLIDRDNISFAPAELSMNFHLVDGLIYDRQIRQKLSYASKCKVEDLNLVETSTLLKKAKINDKNYNSEKQIAVLYAVGDIEDGNESQIDYNSFVPLINKLADDDQVKALVLRVNSPGGSVYGSALIGEALDYFKSKGKPLIVSMGDYAASGGYWISAKADRIFTNPMTLTGSIGIFGMFPCVEGTSRMLGVNVDMVSTNPEASFPNLFKSLSGSQQEVLQKYVDRGYAKFINRVAEGRHMKPERVRHIAEGRVWDGMKALQIGLVDELGGIDDAIAYAAKEAKIDNDYKLSAYPEYDPSFFDMIMSGGVSAASLKNAIRTHDNSLIDTYLINRLLSRSPVQARMGEFMICL